MFYTELTARVMFLGEKQLWTYSVLEEKMFGLVQFWVIVFVR